MSKAQLYSAEKFMFFPENLAALRDGRVVAPVHVRIKPINRCNHDCWYCAYRVSNLQLGEDIDLNDRIPENKMFEIVDDLIAMHVKAVTFSGGGEPLLYRRLPEIVERLAQGGISVATLTNGVNLKGRMADAFAAHGTWVRISTDAWDDDSFVRLRKARPGEFSQLIRNIRDFSSRGSRCVLGVSFIVDNENWRHIANFAQLMKDSGVNHIKISGVVVGNSGKENNDYHAPIRDGVAQEIAQAKALEDDGFTILDHYHDLEERFDKPYTRCPFLGFLTIIGADCNVYACQDKAYTQSGTLGSIRKRSFKEFWFSDENRRRLESLDPSRECNHHCITHQKNLALNRLLELDPQHAVFV